MGILLVTAYNGMWWKTDGQDNAQSYTQGYSKYSLRPRVRTDFLLASLLGLPVMPCWWTRHHAAARSTHHRKRHGSPTLIIV